jgi:SCY1-like protein 1
LVGVGGPTLNYNVEEPPYERAWGQWTHHRGTSKEDGSAVSIFKFTSADPNDRRLALARNGIRRLKMVSTGDGAFYLPKTSQLAHSS